MTDSVGLSPRGRKIDNPDAEGGVRFRASVTSRQNELIERGAPVAEPSCRSKCGRQEEPSIYFFPSGIVTMTPGAPGLPALGSCIRLFGGFGVPGVLPGVIVPGIIVVLFGAGGGGGGAGASPDC
jgi:hypothetical protein